PPREIKTAATMPPARSTSTPKTIQRWPTPSFCTRGSLEQRGLLASCDDRRMSAERASDMVALAAATLHARRDPQRALEAGGDAGEGPLCWAREYRRASVRGVDASPEAIQAATRRVGLDPEGRVAFKVGRPGSLPFPDEQFDLVVHRGGASAEIARVLR